MSIQPSVRIMFLFRTRRRPIILLQRESWCSKDCIIQLCRDNLSSPRIQNAILAKRGMLTLLIDNTLLEKKTNTQIVSVKKIYFSNSKWAAAELPLFVSIISDDQVGFSFHQWWSFPLTSSDSSLLTEDWLIINVNMFLALIHKCKAVCCEGWVGGEGGGGGQMSRYQLIWRVVCFRPL